MIMITTMATITTTAMTIAETEGWREAPLLLWLSPAFPVGAFAYSHGLEWAVEAGDVADAASLSAWLSDLAPFVGASLEVMARDSARMRKGRPFVMANMKTGEGVEAVIAFIRDKGGLGAQSR